MKNVAVVARKGGSGKTTIAVNLAIAAHRRGYAVRLADTDPQGSASESLRVRKGPGPEVLHMSGGEFFELQRTEGAVGSTVVVFRRLRRNCRACRQPL